MLIKRRKEMNNEERIEKIIVRLRKNQRYRAIAYTIHAILWGTLFLLQILVVMPTLLKLQNVQNFKLWIGSIIVCGSIMVLCIFAIYNNYKKRKYRDSSKVTIEANFHKEAMMMWMPGGKSLTMGVYYFVAYYVEGNRTYRFKGLVQDDQEDLYYVLERLRKDGIFPKIKVLVNPHNYKDYKMLSYEYIESLLMQNIQLVGEELDDCYNTSDKWKYIKA